MFFLIKIVKQLSINKSLLFTVSPLPDTTSSITSLQLTEVTNDYLITCDS